MQTQPTSTDADMASTGFLNDDVHDGDHASSSIQAVMINRPRSELYAFWREFRNLPLFMANVRSVSSDGRDWVIAGPGGMDVELETEIVEDRPGEKIAPALHGGGGRRSRGLGRVPRQRLRAGDRGPGHDQL